MRHADLLECPRLISPSTIAIFLFWCRHRLIVELGARIAGQGEFGFGCGDTVPGRCKLVGLDARHSVPNSLIDQGLVFPPEQCRRRYAGFRRDIGDSVTGAKTVRNLPTDRVRIRLGHCNPPMDHSASCLIWMVHFQGHGSCGSLHGVMPDGQVFVEVVEDHPDGSLTLLGWVTLGHDLYPSQKRMRHQTRHGSPCHGSQRQGSHTVKPLSIGYFE